MALAYARLDQPGEALSICEDIEKSKVTDSTVIETIGYVYRRIGRFDLLSNLFTSALNSADQATAVDMSRQAYVAGVQSFTVDSLSTLAAKLTKLTGENIYYAWAAFGLYLKSLDSEDASSKLNLALAMLEKAEVETSPVPNKEGKSRNDTCGRLHAYLNFFKIMILTKLGRWSDVSHIVKSCIQSGLLSEEERAAMLADIELLSAREKKSSPNPIGAVEEIIFKLAAGESKYEEFLDVFKTHIKSTLVRSDCVVSAAPYLALVREPSDLVEFLKSELHASPISEIKFLNLSKLLYGVAKDQVDALALLNRALEVIETEHVNDECSPGKQLLLLSAIVLLEDESNLIPALAILEYGTNRFAQCAHFKLVQCIGYTRFGLMEKGIERFDALGIKNAQWRSLFWLLESPLQEFFSEEKSIVFEHAVDFFKTNKTELQYAIASMVEQVTFFKFHDFQDEIKACENSAVRNHVLREMSWQKLLDGGEVNVPDQTNTISDREYDFSPLLFITMPRLNSLTPQELVGKISARRKFPARACGFRWPVDEAHPERRKLVELSKDRILGKMISRLDTGLREQLIRVTILAAKGEWEQVLEVSENDQKTSVELINKITKIVFHQKEAASGDLETVQSDLVSLSEISIDTTNWLTLVSSTRRLLNGELQSLVFVIEHAAAALPKKSAERKVLKAVVNALKQSVDHLISQHLPKLSLPRDTLSVLPSSLKLDEFVHEFESYLAAEKSCLRTELERLAGKLKSIKF
jgi:hypothetical protein